MKIKLSVFFISILFLVSGCVSNHTKLLYNKKPAFYSYIFGDVRSNHIDTEHDADVYVAPASCQKTIIALLAYKTFGADYRYATKLYVTKKKGKIRDAIITFTGDPTLTTDNLLRLLRPLRGTTIAGKVLLDATLFKTPPHSSNLMLDDLGTDYGQPVSSINIDKNLIIVTVRPGKLNKLAYLINDIGYPIDSEVMTIHEPSKLKLSIRDNRIKATGNINLNSVPLELKISPIDLDYYLLYKVKQAMKSAKIKGRVKIIHNEAQLPINLILLNTIESEPLGDIIPIALKKSDNLVFDSIYLKIIHTQGDQEIKEWDDGSSIIKSLIYKYFGIDVADAKFVDGSGLSRYDHVQPRKFFAILQQGYAEHDFVAALAYPGEPDSTLAHRDKLLRYIKAKTGNMSGISCLCGYSVSRYPKAFVIVANSFASPNKELFPILDDFVNRYCGN